MHKHGKTWIENINTQSITRLFIRLPAPIETYTFIVLYGCFKNPLSKGLAKPFIHLIFGISQMSPRLPVKMSSHTSLQVLARATKPTMHKSLTIPTTAYIKIANHDTKAVPQRPEKCEICSVCFLLLSCMQSPAPPLCTTPTSQLSLQSALTDRLLVFCHTWQRILFYLSLMIKYY